MRLRRMTIRFRLVLAIMLVTAVTTSAMVAVMTVISRNGARDEGYDLANQIAQGNGRAIGGDLAGAVATARDLAQVLGALSSTKTDRAAADAALRDVIAAHPQYLGVWTGWEPNAFDGKDAAYRGAPGHDDTGRYVPYWVWTDGKVTNTPMVDYDKAGPGDFYQIPKTTGHEKIIEPYPYEIGGKTTLLTTVAEPIMRDGRFVGVAGVDLQLDRLKGGVAGIRPYDSGRAVLVTGTGAVIAGGDGEEAGKPVDSARAAIAAEARTASGPVRKVSQRGGRQVVDSAVAIPLGEADTWVLVVTIPTSELLTNADRARNAGVLLAVLAVLVGAVAAQLIAGAVVRPIVHLRRRLSEIADGDGDLTQRITANRDDETGDLASAFNQFIAKIADTVRGIQSASAEVGTATGAMRSSTALIGQSADDSSARAALAAGAAEQVGTSISDVSAGAEQMSASIKEIAQSAADSARAAGAAVTQIEETTGAVAALDSSTAEIDEVLNAIAAIAEQTNLLALNATIEAARAGEAGKGFAVVAGEVKDLAQETAVATSNISAKIAAIRADTQNAVAAIGGINQVIDQVNDYSVTIATAVEEQSATTNEMARAISEAAAGAREISESVAGVAMATSHTSDGTAATMRAMGNLEAVQNQLRGLVAQFKV